MLNLSDVSFSILTGIPMIYGAISDSKSWGNSEIANAYCDRYEVVSRDVIGYGGNYNSGLAFDQNRVCIADTTKSWASVSDALTDLSGTEIVYELATPTEISLTPTQVRGLLGNNYLSCNTGDLEIEYITDEEEE